MPRLIRAFIVHCRLQTEIKATSLHRSVKHIGSNKSRNVTQSIFFFYESKKPLAFKHGASYEALLPRAKLTFAQSSQLGQNYRSRNVSVKSPDGTIGDRVTYTSKAFRET